MCSPISISQSKLWFKEEIIFSIEYLIPMASSNFLFISSIRVLIFISFKSLNIKYKSNRSFIVSGLSHKAFNLYSKRLYRFSVLKISLFVNEASYNLQQVKFRSSIFIVSSLSLKL